MSVFFNNVFFIFKRQLSATSLLSFSNSTSGNIDSLKTSVINHPLDERGVSMIELAISLPLIMILITGIIDYGYGMQTLNNISAATRAGVRAGSKASELTSDINLNRNPARACGINNGHTPLTCNPSMIAPPTNPQQETIADAVMRATCSYLDQWNLEDFVVRMRLEEIPGTERAYDIAFTGNDPTAVTLNALKKLTVEVLKDPNQSDAGLCIVCIDSFVPALRWENIRAKNTTVMPGDCI